MCTATAAADNVSSFASMYPYHKKDALPCPKMLFSKRTWLFISFSVILRCLQGLKLLKDLIDDSFSVAMKKAANKRHFVFIWCIAIILGTGILYTAYRVIREKT